MKSLSLVIAFMILTVSALAQAGPETGDLKQPEPSSEQPEPPPEAQGEAPGCNVKPLLACAELGNAIERLQCFDDAASGVAAGPAAEAEADPASEAEEAEIEEGAPDLAAPEPEPFTPRSPEEIIEADDSMVADCQFLGSVRGKSGFGGLAGGRARKGTHKSARKQAFKLGATHIVFGSFNNHTFGVGLSSTEARAYKCGTASG